MKRKAAKRAVTVEARAKSNEPCNVCGQGGSDTPVHAVTLPVGRVAPMCEACERNDFRVAEAERRTDPRCVCQPLVPRLDCPVHVPSVAVSA